MSPTGGGRQGGPVGWSGRVARKGGTRMGLFGRRKRGGGLRGTARVVSCSGAPSNATHGSLHMNLVVEVPGVPAYSHEYRKMAARVDKWPHPGEVLPVGVDPADLRNVEVLWDERPRTADTARVQAERMAAMLRQQQAGPGGPGTAGVPPEMAGMVEQLQQMYPGAIIDVGSDPAGPDDASAVVEQIQQMFPGAGAGGAHVVATRSGGDPVERLAKLAQLRDAGIVDQAQFEQLKAQILEQADIDPD